MWQQGSVLWPRWRTCCLVLSLSWRAVAAVAYLLSGVVFNCHGTLWPRQWVHCNALWQSWLVFLASSQPTKTGANRRSGEGSPCISSAPK